MPTFTHNRRTVQKGDDNLSGLFHHGAKIQTFIARFKIYDNEQIPAFREQVRGVLGESDAGLLYVGFNEALNNAIAHSQALNNPVQPILVKLVIIKGKIIIIRIKHQQGGFSGNQLLTAIRTIRGDPFETVVDKESQRGLMLIDAIFDKVCYSRNGREIMMVKLLREKAG